MPPRHRDGCKSTSSISAPTGRVAAIPAPRPRTRARSPAAATAEPTTSGRVTCRMKSWSTATDCDRGQQARLPSRSATWRVPAEGHRDVRRGDREHEHPRTEAEQRHGPVRHDEFRSEHQGHDLGAGERGARRGQDGPSAPDECQAGAARARARPSRSPRAASSAILGTTRASIDWNRNTGILVTVIAARS